MKKFLSLQNWSISNRAFVFLFVLLLLVYSNTFQASWHFDDRHSIVDNAKVHITELSLKSLSQTMQHPDAQHLWRPLAYLTFGLNWYVGHDDVFGYHVVNFIIHFITAYLLFHTFLGLFRSPVLSGSSSNDAHFISLLAAILWTTNPTQTQAVTYIVQRMTLLAALFYIGGIFFYLRARLTESRHYRNLFFTLCAICWLFALASKENAILLPLVLILVEVIFFKNPSGSLIRKQYLVIFMAGSLAVGILGCIIFLRANPLAIFSGYGDRFFTPWERLLTQPRVLLFYLTQIFYPQPSRLSIEHDFAISTSLFCPWTTLPAILLVIGLTSGAVLNTQRQPLLCFAILFFFINHAIESSIVPLEIIFEHRNYLPSMFLFVPVATGVLWLLNRYKKKKPFLYWVVFGLGICLISGFGIATYARNRVWLTEVSLWSDARRKAPSMHRPVHNLSMALYDSNGRLDEALELYRRADKLKMHRRSNRVWLYGNIANLHFRAGRYDMAETYYQQAIDMAPQNKSIRYRLAETLTQQIKWTAALTPLNTLLKGDPQNSDYLNLKGIIFLNQMKPERALLAFRLAGKKNPQQSTAYVNAGRALLAIGKFDQAAKLFKFGIELEPENLKTYIRLLDINIRRGDEEEAKDLSAFLVGSASADDIGMTIAELSKEPFFTALDYHNLLDTITVEIRKKLPRTSVESKLE